MLPIPMRWLLTAIVLPVVISTPSFANAGQDETRWVPGRVLVEPNPGVNMEDFKGLLQRNGGHSKGTIGSLRVHVVEVPEQAEAAVAAALAHNPKIKFAEMDMLMAPTATSANDPNYSSAWHLDTLQAPIAWDSSKGDGVTVAILDTGVDGSHPDLQGQLVPGWDTYNNKADTSPLCAHGTSVAGIVAAASNNGIGVTSIAWDTKIMPMRVVGSDCWASASALAGALTWAADRGARVASMSFAGVAANSTVTTGANYMRSKGGVVFAAAGNSGSASSTAPNPAMMVVAATDPDDMLRSFSSYGDFVDLAAPGGGIWTTNSGGGYGTFGGTSSSTPVAAAVGALVLAADPSLTPDEVEDILKGSSVDLGSPGKDEFFGYGRVDAAAATAAAGGLLDNCTLVTNLDQRDTDGDGYGNLCDGDLNNDGDTNTLDLNLYKLAHRSESGDPNYNADADFNGDGVINTLDLNIYKGLHRKPPGPSCCGSF